ncbi:MAG TPA: hypothetical protein HPP80_07410 [Rhodospirillaceae bacterium]|nr:hypothetical protein [Rhodospirillaceae bacterium]
MKSRFVTMLILMLVQGGFAEAADGAKLGSWSLGGAEGARTTLWENGGGVALGVASPNAVGPLLSSSGGMQSGGFLAWRGDDYRLDASLTANLGGSVTAGFGAVMGALPGEAGTSFGVRLATARASDRFTVNPVSNLSLAEAPSALSDINVSFTVNHALTSNLSFIGTAEAHRPTALPADGGAAQPHYLLGAGLGLRF